MLIYTQIGLKNYISKLCNTNAMSKAEANAKIRHKTLGEQTFEIYVKGLIEPIKTVVKSGKS